LWLDATNKGLVVVCGLVTPYQPMIYLPRYSGFD
jgi:hypothetical protein